jgi:hypothetical protein
MGQKQYVWSTTQFPSMQLPITLHHNKWTCLYRTTTTLQHVFNNPAQDIQDISSSYQKQLTPQQDFADSPQLNLGHHL